MSGNYHALTVTKTGNVTMLFGVPAPGEPAGMMTAVDEADPLRPVSPYVQNLFAAAFFCPGPKSAIAIGLGGGAFHRLFAAAFPESTLLTVELDETVVQLAIERMGFKPSAKMPVVVAEGRDFLRRARAQWDWVVLDIYRGLLVPPQVRTVEFYRECAARVAPGGVLVTNLFSFSKTLHDDLRTMREVFPQVLCFGGGGNTITCAVNEPVPDMRYTMEFFEVRGAILRLEQVRRAVQPWPAAQVGAATVLRDPSPSP